MNKYFKNIDYKVLDKKIAYKGNRVIVEEVDYYNPRQDKNIHMEHVLAGEAVVIMPITEDNELIMVQEARTPIEKIVLTFPAGMIEKGEDPKQAAIRELEEETGYLTHNIKKIREIHPTIGYSNEKLIIFLAKDLEKTHMHLDDTEDIEVVKIPLEEVKKMLDKNEIITASETVALLHYFTYECNK